MALNARPRRRLGLALTGVLLAVVALSGLAVAMGWGPDQPVSDQEPSQPLDATAPAVEGTVTDDAGRPVEGAVVGARPLAGSPPVPELVVTTDASGRYRWALPAGEYELVATTPDRSSAPVEVTVDDGVTEADLVLGS